MTLYLLKFNNYYNRIVKKYNTVSEYEQNSEVLGTYEGINFNPNDGISTAQILNHNDDNPDYVLVVNQDNEIVSRWFVIESVRTRSQQYNMTLYRDTIADFYDSIITAPSFIEKGMLSKDNPLIFNNEAMTYNQIKTKEFTIKDKTNIPWLVGYMAANTPETTIEIETEVISTNYIYNTLSEYTYYIYSGNSRFLAEENDVNFTINFYRTVSSLTNTYNQHFYSWNRSGSSGNPRVEGATNRKPYLYIITDVGNNHFGYKHGSEYSNSTIYEEILTTELPKINWAAYSPSAYLSGLKNQTQLASLLAEEGKTIKAGNKYYKVHINRGLQEYKSGNVSPQSALGTAMTGIANKLIENDCLNSNITEPRFQINAMYTSYNVTFEEFYPDSIITLTIPSNRPHSVTPYDVFCIPYGEIYWGSAGGDTQKTSAEQGYKLASALIKKLVTGSDALLYDIQLLPYCPLPQTRLTTVSTVTTMSVTSYDIPLSHNNDILSGIFWVENPDFSFSISAPEDMELDFPELALDVKVRNETNIHRLTSPNYNGTFEFSAVKNNGVQYFDIDCSYKPFTPYIKVAPRFNGLYGNDFNDARGLICGGDFSLPQIRDQWQSYQLNNKNYQEIFDRQITNMDRNNAVQRELEKWNVGANVLTAGASGILAGSMVGGPIGGAIGGVASAGASLIAGSQDIKLNEQLRTEAIEYTKDQFGYQLGNIQAMPYSLTKVSAFNPNNKIFPILELYTCTDTEKNALKEKIKYNGMTVMTIGTIEDYIGIERSYIKSKLIRLENITDDFHVVNMISSELNKGVFI